MLDINERKMAEDAKKGLEYAEAANKQIRIFWLI
jgi:hypothetical protein